MANDCIPFYEGAYTQKLTVHNTLAVVGKRFVAALGARPAGARAGTGQNAGLATTAEGGNLTTAGPAAADAMVGGVAMYDSPAQGKVGVIRGAGTVVPVTSGAAVAAGDELEVTALGKVIPWATSGVKVGRALSTVAGADLDVEVELYSTEGK